MEVLKKKNLFSINYAITDYESAASLIIENGSSHTSFGMTALAVHGLIEAVWDKNLAKTINEIHLITPDGQPIRWALNSLSNAGLKDRVCGPNLTLHVLEKSNERHLKVFLYGSTQHTLMLLQSFIVENYPNVEVCGIHADRFREATPEEDTQDIENINKSGAHIVLVGRGCPRQERWVAAHIGKVNAAMMAVGAAFDFHSGVRKRSPEWMQRTGLEWLYRLLQDPKRLWKRYLTTNLYFIYLFFRHKFSLNRSIHPRT